MWGQERTDRLAGIFLVPRRRSAGDFRGVPAPYFSTSGDHPPSIWEAQDRRVNATAAQDHRVMRLTLKARN